MKMPREVKFYILISWYTIVRRPTLLPEKRLKLVVFHEITQKQIKALRDHAVKFIKRVSLNDEANRVARGNPLTGFRLRGLPLNAAFNLHFHNPDSSNGSHGITYSILDRRIVAEFLANSATKRAVHCMCNALFRQIACIFK
jgi:hypothetical protein